MEYIILTSFTMHHSEDLRCQLKLNFSASSRCCWCWWRCLTCWPSRGSWADLFGDSGRRSYLLFPSRTCVSSWSCCCVSPRLLNDYFVSVPFLRHPSELAFQIVNDANIVLGPRQLILIAVNRLLHLVQLVVVFLYRQNCTLISNSNYASFLYSYFVRCTICCSNSAMSFPERSTYKSVATSSGLSSVSLPQICSTRLLAFCISLARD